MDQETDQETRDYRQHLVLAEQKAQEDYDKAVLALSGGGLGISLAFIEKVVGPEPLRSAGLLAGAWLSWAVSIASVLVSYFLSRHALRCAIEQVDGTRPHIRRLGGKMATATEIANVASGLCFVLGVVLITFFVIANLEAKNAQDPKAVKPAASATQNRRLRSPSTSSKAAVTGRVRSTASTAKAVREAGRWLTPWQLTPRCTGHLSSRPGAGDLPKRWPTDEIGIWCGNE